MNTRKNKKYTIAAAAALLSIIILAAPVFADTEPLPDTTGTETEAPAEGETPLVDGVELAPAEEPVEEPATEVEAVGETPTEETASTEEPSADEPPVAEEPVAAEGETMEEVSSDEAPPAEESPMEKPVDEPESVPQALAAADLELAGADGELLDMACGETVEALSADPYFTVGTQVYRWLPAGGDCAPYTAAGDICTVSIGDTPIQDAIDYIESNGTIPSDRKIYVEAESYTETVTIDGSLNNLNNLNGLIGVDGSESTTLNGTMEFTNLTGGFTLEGFTVNGRVYFHDMEGTITVKDVAVSSPTTEGLVISDVDSAVVLEDVSASNNFQTGATISNAVGGVVNNITIKNSNFDANGTTYGNVYGLHINTLGKVFIDGITANNNRGGGIYIVNDFSALTMKNAVLANNDADPDLDIYGTSLYAATSSTAAVLLENVYVLNDQDNFYAIQLTTSGNVIIRNAQVVDNLGAGLKVNNAGGTGYVKIYNSRFNNNAGNGADIESKGVVYLSSVQAMDSTTGSGMLIDNCQQIEVEPGVYQCQGIGTVTITSPRSYGADGANNFSGNAVNGLKVNSNKAIKLYNVIANGNGNTGIDLANDLGSGGITFKKNIPSTLYFTFNNSASNNTAGYGLTAASRGAIRVEYLTAHNNGLDGAKLDNDNALTNPGAIIKYSTFNENLLRGLNIPSKGNIALTNVSASGNGVDGAYFYTLNGIGGVSIKGIRGYTCLFNNNTDRGIEIYAKGTITLKNIEVDENGTTAYIENNTAPRSRNVSITNATFNEVISGWGLNVYSLGNITLNNVLVNLNQGGGAELDNSTGLGRVTVKYSYFDENAGTGFAAGLRVYSNRNISLYTVSASLNGDHGVYLDNCMEDAGVCVGTGSVSIKSGRGVRNIFSGNGDSGLYIETRGGVSIRYIDASNNTGAGLRIISSAYPVSGNVSITASRSLRNMFMNNTGIGLDVETKGSISLRYLDVYGNGSNGAQLLNDVSAYARPVTIKDSTFNKNLGTGLYVRSNGAIKLQGVEASDNSVFDSNTTNNTSGAKDVLSLAEGSDRWHFTGALNDPLSITISSAFFDPYVEVYASSGALLWSDDNSGGGTAASISGVLLPAGDTYTVVISAADGGSGYYEFDLNGSSGGQVAYSGVRLENTTGSAGVKILYSSLMGFGGRFWNNNYIGAYIVTHGAVSLNRLDIGYNGYDGLDVSNTYESERPVSIKTAVVEGNIRYGVLVASYGNITLSKVNADFNRGFGASLGNSGTVNARWIKVSNSTFNDNFVNVAGEDGLAIASNGAITLSSVEAKNNGDKGAHLDNYANAYVANVRIVGKNNAFDGNANDGLYIVSYGEVSLANFSASNNGRYGVYIQNGISSTVEKNIKINNSISKSFNSILDNTSIGLFVISNGNITINKVNSSGNSTNANISHNNPVELKKVTVTNSIFAVSTTGSGIYMVDIHGPVVITNVTAAGNASAGLNIQNDGTAGQFVTIKKTNVSGNGNAGIWVDSAGRVTADRITAYDNTFDGLHIVTSLGTDTVTVANSTFFGNQDQGLYVNSAGLVTIKSVTASDNSTNGIYVQGTGYIPVVLYKVDALENGDTGIYLFQASDVLATYVTSMGNGNLGNDGDGLYVEGNGLTTVTLKYCLFLGNYGNGVDLYDTNGIPTIINTIIFGNDLDFDLDEELFIHA